VLRHDTLEAIGVAEYPVGHVSGVAAADCAFPIFIDERVGLLGVIEALHRILKRNTAPVAGDGVDELLTVPGRAVEVDCDDHISVGGQGSKFEL
jgi:hypothetical protein